MYYTKPILSIDQQINLLEARGLIISDKQEASHYLTFINYYRLSGYTLFFEQIVNGKRNHQFKLDTTFNNIIEVYDFDRHLRMLVMDAIERIEVAVRTQICTNMAISHNDAYWYLNKDLFKPEFNHRAFIEKCKNEQKNSKEKFVIHYKNTYTQPEMLPSWMIVELLSMGTWSILYQNLKNRSDKKCIAKVFRLSLVEFESCLHVLTYIRNLCAHHSRLWNRHFTLKPMQIKGFETYLTPNNVFATQAALIHIFLKIISPKNKWSTKLYQLMSSHPFIDITDMGFIQKWQNDPFWDIEI